MHVTLAKKNVCLTERKKAKVSMQDCHTYVIFMDQKQLRVKRLNKNKFSQLPTRLCCQSIPITAAKDVARFFHWKGPESSSQIEHYNKRGHLVFLEWFCNRQ
jgi:hypothetical protein